MQANHKPDPESHPDSLHIFWILASVALCGLLQCGTEGLRSSEAKRRLAQYGLNSDAEIRADSLLPAVFRRLREPLSLMLLAAGMASIATGDGVGGSIIVVILALSVGLGTFSGRPCGQSRGSVAAVGGA
jgi:P-type Mg2+ transporter